MTEFVSEVLEHIERNPTRCPYCGKSLDSRLMGYPIVDLLVLLESLRLNGIRPEQLREYKLDIEFAQKTVLNGMREQVVKLFENYKEPTKSREL